jgi:RNA polymerase sigma-70 factor (ECF subfamily)
MALDAATPLDSDDRRRLVAFWFMEYQSSLFRYLARLLGDEEHAADLLQDTFVRAFSAVDVRVPPPNPSAWLYRIATNLAYDVLRRRKRLRWLRLSGDAQAPAFESGVAVAQSVRDCLARLRPKDAEALLLYEYAGLSCVEIAALSGEEPASVRVRLYRARIQFRRLYKQELA